jgi:hypothetical protein
MAGWVREALPYVPVPSQPVIHLDVMLPIPEPVPVHDLVISLSGFQMFQQYVRASPSVSGIFVALIIWLADSFPLTAQLPDLIGFSHIQNREFHH